MGYLRTVGGGLQTVEYSRSIRNSIEKRKAPMALAENMDKANHRLLFCVERDACRYFLVFFSCCSRSLSLTMGLTLVNHRWPFSGSHEHPFMR